MTDPSALTPREREVLALLATGLSNKEIAAALSISCWTVRAQLYRAYDKIGARNRTEAALWALRAGVAQL